MKKSCYGIAIENCNQCPSSKLYMRRYICTHPANKTCDIEIGFLRGRTTDLKVLDRGVATFCPLPDHKENGNLDK